MNKATQNKKEFLSRVLLQDDGFKLMEIKKISPSPRNYRKTFDKKAMEDLTASVKAKGVLQPILIRPLKNNGTFEIVAGHRRFEAATNAGLKNIPAIIKNLNDEEALEIQVIENSQREDPNPMEEAWGFKELLNLGKHTPETLAAKIDRSPAYVLGRLNLLKIPKEAQDKIVKGEISLGHALLITRLRHPNEQKEFLKMISEDNGMTLKEAKQQIEDFSTNIEKAVFNTDACNKCQFLSSNQTVIFPELKKSGRCMDRGCFFAKTKDFWKANLEKIKKAGFKVITKEDELTQLHNSNKSEQIVAPDAEGYHTKPKKYKSQCMKCTEHHVFFMIEKTGYEDNSRIDIGELCLNKKCLNAMQGLKKTDDEETQSGGRTSTYKIAEHARSCRDRFLRQTLPAKVNTSESLKYRLLIYHLLDRFDGFKNRTEIIKKYFSDYEDTYNKYNYKIYKAIAAFPIDQLSNALREILTAAIDRTDPDVLLRMTDEAGIDMSRDFGVDKAFLNTKTKAELVAFANQFKLDCPAGGVNAKKGELVDCIVKQDLRGKLPAEVVEECKIEDEETGNDFLDDEEEEENNGKN